MSERVKTYFAMLKGLSSEDLDRSVRELAAREKQDVARCIAHIAEIGERNFHLELGHRSLFELCVNRLSLGEGTVYRRMQVARICRRFPEILEALFRGHILRTSPRERAREEGPEAEAGASATARGTKTEPLPGR